jgi:hypothetical protein
MNAFARRSPSFFVLFGVGFGLALGLGFAVPAAATLPCTLQDTSSVSSDGGWLLVLPDGNGPTLASIGATVEVRLVDCETGDPIVGYPAQDVVLDDHGAATFAFCPGGTIADGPTDDEGRTTISGGLAGGGHANGVMLVYVGGNPMDRYPLPLSVASPDLDASLAVDLADVGLFATEFDLGVSFRADFTGDARIDLADVGVFASALGASCP